MADGISINIESAPMANALKAWQKELGKSFPGFMRSEAQKALKEIIRGTPIFKKAGKVKEISVDVENTVGTLREKSFRSEKIRKLIRQKKVDELTKMFSYLPRGTHRLGSKRVVTTFSKKQHRPFTATFEKTRRRESDLLTLDWKKQKNFKKELSKRLGFLKAGWGASAEKLRLKLPQYAARHRRSVQTSDYQEKFSSNDLSISMINRKVKFRPTSMKFLIERSLFRRARNMEGLLKRMVEGKAAKVGFTARGGFHKDIVFNL